MSNHTGSYGPGLMFSSFRHLPSRADLPMPVHFQLRHTYGFTSMKDFCDDKTPAILLAILQAGHCHEVSYKRALAIWIKARDRRTDLINQEQTMDKEDDTEETYGNADRNEMIALLQHAKGAQFVRVQQCWSRLQNDEGKKHARETGPTLTYKAHGLDLKEGDTVVVQYGERYGIGVVAEVLGEVPTSSEYDYRRPLKWVVQLVDGVRSASLTRHDAQILKRLTESEAHDRLERLTRQLGISLDDETLALPKGE